MSGQGTMRMGWASVGLGLAMLGAGAAGWGQQAPAAQTTPAPARDGAATGPVGPVSVETVAEGKAGSTPAEPGQTVDRIVAIVNGALILESDVDEERRFAAFQPFTTPSGDFSRQQAVERLINRTLILQQAKLQPGKEITATDVQTQIATLRKDIPACKKDQCETDAGWAKFLADQGFTAAELQQRWKERMEVLQYIENRFRMGIRIEPAEIKVYYDKTMLPEYAKQKVTPPKMADISDRIQEVLLQQRVTKLLQDWLKSLRAQGTVQIMKPGEVAP
jgi:peptidyl-prolyl cis-trans isomerase SurA